MADPDVADAVAIDTDLLADLPLPAHEAGSDKHDRGTALVVGGCAETPGSMLLAGLAVLRAGAGRLQVALVASDAAALAVAVPEAKVMAIGDDAGRVVDHDRSALRQALGSADAVLVGSGATADGAQHLLELAVEEMAGTDATLVVDAAALDALARDPTMLRDRADRTLLIPNGTEAAKLLGSAPGELDPGAMATAVVARTGCTTAVRGPDTYVAAPAGPLLVERSGPVGLATSGSGDVFAGLVAGYLARGAHPRTAALWAAHVHARAGCLAVDRHGPVNFLARDVVDLLADAQRA